MIYAREQFVKKRTNGIIQLIGMITEVEDIRTTEELKKSGIVESVVITQCLSQLRKSDK